MKGIWKAAVSMLLAIVLVLPVFAGCDRSTPSEDQEDNQQTTVVDKDEEQQAQLVVLPSEGNGNGVLSLSVSDEVDAQAESSLITKTVQALTTPANLPVDWELLWLSGTHSDGLVTRYLSYALASPIMTTNGEKWSSKITLRLLERFEGTAMLRVSLKEDPSISDYVRVEAPLPKASIEAEFEYAVFPAGGVEIPVTNLLQTAPAMFSVDFRCEYKSFIPDLDVKVVYENGDEEDMSLSANLYVSEYKYRFVYQIRLERTDIEKIVVTSQDSYKLNGAKVNLTISCTPIGIQEISVENNLASASNRTLDFSAGEAVGGYLLNIRGTFFFPLSNVPASERFTVEVYYECVAPYEGDFKITAKLSESPASAMSTFSYQDTRTIKGNFAVSISEGYESYNYANFSLAFVPTNTDYVHDASTRFVNVKVFYYEGEYDPTYVPSRYKI